MDVVIIKTRASLPMEALDRIEDRYKKKLEAAGCTNFVVIAVSEGADVSVMKV